MSQAKVKKILEETDIKAQEILSNAENRSQIVIQTANSEAERIIEEARKKAQNEYETIKEQAYQEGFKKGEEDGLAKLNNDAEEALKSLETLSQSSYELKQNIIDSASRDIVELITVISDKVCHQAFNPQSLFKMTVDAIKLLNDKETITIIVSPRLVDAINQMVPNFKTLFPNLKFLKITEDASLSPDGVIVETPTTRLDSRISSQIGELAQKMLMSGNDGMEQK